MKKIPDWIIIKYNTSPARFVCERCGEKRTIHLPATIKDFIMQAEAFTETHKYCKNKLEEVGI